MIKTSVIIPVYNTASYLKECIESVFNQTQKELEVIAINDGSTDNSWDILLEMKIKYPELVIINQENHGLGYTRNIGIEKARGEYIYFLDSDDYIIKNTLETCYEVASCNTLDVVLFDAANFLDLPSHKFIYPNPDDRHEIILERQEVFSGIYFLEKYYLKNYEPSACLVYCSIEFIKRNGIKFLSRVYFEDNEFHCRIMLFAKKVMYIPQTFYQRRCRDDSITGSRFDLRKAKDHIEVIRAIKDLKTINNGKGWTVLREIDLNLLLHVAYMCAKNNLYHQEKCLSKWILEAEIMIFDRQIVDINDLVDICHMISLCEYFPKTELCVERTCIHDKYMQLLTQVLVQLPLQNSDMRIAIYGCGKYSQKLLQVYKEFVGDIRADVVFLDTFIVENNMSCNEFPVKNVKTIENEKFDLILISSPQYEMEMKETIHQLYNDKFPSIMLYGELKIRL